MKEKKELTKIIDWHWLDGDIEEEFEEYKKIERAVSGYYTDEGPVICRLRPENLEKNRAFPVINIYLSQYEYWGLDFSMLKPIGDTFVNLVTAPMRYAPFFNKSTELFTHFLINDAGIDPEAFIESLDQLKEKPIGTLYGPTTLYTPIALHFERHGEYGNLRDFLISAKKDYEFDAEAEMKKYCEKNNLDFKSASLAIDALFPIIESLRITRLRND